jgi:hypothetical protein
MKSLLVLAILFTVQARADEFLGKRDKSNFLGAMISACDETWCQGDFYYEFYSINCDDVTKSCVMEMYMAPQSDEEENLPGIDVSCTFNKISSIDDLLDPDFGPSESIYYQMHDCLGKLEAEYFETP